MKKIYTLALAVVSTGAFAQSTSLIKKSGLLETVKPISINPSIFNVAQGGPDTLGLTEFRAALVADDAGLNGFQTGGYIFGSAHAEFTDPNAGNIFQDNLAFARIYTVLNAPYTVTGVVLLPVLKYSANATTTTSKLVIKAQTIADNKAIYANTSTSLDTTGLNTTLATVNLNYADIDTTDFNILPFPATAQVATDFAISIDFSSFAANGDTIAFPADQTTDGLSTTLFQIKQGVVGTAGQAFWAWGNAVLQSFVERDVAVFPIVDDAAAAITEQSFFDGLKLGQSYPNPTVDNAKVEIELQNASKNVTLKVIDMKGRTLLTNEMGTQSAGKHSFDLNVSGLASGNYLYMLTADGHNLVKQMSIVK